MKSVGIIGFGRFGQLFARLLSRYVDIVIFEQDKDCHIPDTYTRASSLSEVCQVDILFLIVPISALKSLCQSIAPYVDTHTIVCDVASVKTKPREWMQEVFGAHQPLVFTHPLFGPDSVARSGVEGKKIVLCTESDSRGLNVVKDLVSTLQLQVLETTTEDHDRQMARSQALVHYIGRGLAPLELFEQEIATPDYDRLLAMVSLVKHDTMELFVDMQQYNPYAAAMRQALLDSLMALESTL